MAEESGVEVDIVVGINNKAIEIDNVPSDNRVPALAWL